MIYMYLIQHNSSKETQLILFQDINSHDRFSIRKECIQAYLLLPFRLMALLYSVFPSIKSPKEFRISTAAFLLRPICSEYSSLHDLNTVLDHLLLLTVA